MPKFKKNTNFKMRSPFREEEEKETTKKIINQDLMREVGEASSKVSTPTDWGKIISENLAKLDTAKVPGKKPEVKGGGEVVDESGNLETSNVDDVDEVTKVGNVGEVDTDKPVMNPYAEDEKLLDVDTSGTGSYRDTGIKEDKGYENPYTKNDDSIEIKKDSSGPKEVDPKKAQKTEDSPAAYKKPSNFKMRSGNSPLYKAMGSSPAKVNIDMDLMREVGAKTTEGKIDKY